MCVTNPPSVLQMQEGVKALVEYVRKKEDSVSLLNETHNIHLQLTFKKVPDVANKIIRMLVIYFVIDYE